MQAKNRFNIKRYLGVNQLFHAVILIGNVAVFLALMFSTFSDRISPEKGMFFPYFGLAFPVIFIFNLVFLFYWIIRLRKYVLLSVLGLIISWHQISVYFPIHKQTKEVPVGAIKILSYNVRAFNYVSHTEDTPNPTIQYILDQDADIVCLQEFGWSKNEGYLDRKTILKAFEKYPYFKFTISSANNWHAEGLACFSKYPILSSHKLNFKSKYNGSAYYCIKIGDRKIDLINNHLESNKFTSDDIGVYKKVFKDFNPNHLEDFNDIVIRKMDQAFKYRAKQAQVVAEEIKKCQHDLIVVGDFNDSPISYAYHTVSKNLDDAFVDTGFGPGISYNENRFYFRIDNILHSPSIKAYNCKVDRIRLSDHFPISCYVTFQ
ncbi:MAG: endonuclease/exonuclease/phosphatase family protein [Bacteroidales bacterium]|nr:endonuclease/exonuclease/phosphatase family protein [Bacteroidales bacterium]